MVFWLVLLWSLSSLMLSLSWVSSWGLHTQCYLAGALCRAGRRTRSKWRGRRWRRRWWWRWAQNQWRAVPSKHLRTAELCDCVKWLGKSARKDIHKESGARQSFVRWKKKQVYYWGLEEAAAPPHPGIKYNRILWQSTQRSATHAYHCALRRQTFALGTDSAATFVSFRVVVIRAPNLVGQYNFLSLLQLLPIF